MNPRTTTLAAVALTGLFTLTACGSGGDDEPQAAATSAQPTSTVKATTTSATRTSAAGDLDKKAGEVASESKKESSQAAAPAEPRANKVSKDKPASTPVVQVPERAGTAAHEARGDHLAAPAGEEEYEAPAEQAPEPVEAAAPEPPVHDPNPIDAQTVPAGETYYASCSQAPGPLLPHQAGYRDALDADGDGVACEPDESSILEAATAPAGGYASCKAAREAGAKTPLRQGDPGYNAQLDKDGDGVACE